MTCGTPNFPQQVTPKLSLWPHEYVNNDNSQDRRTRDWLSRQQRGSCTDSLTDAPKTPILGRPEMDYSREVQVVSKKWPDPVPRPRAEGVSQVILEK
ncbi:hypothetical protein I7I48_07941 [Histoplasma ohiense]|nr:hypothetical protein I7I48_07941 [Histoplasma ohiense (nom. inval.)]